MSDFTPMLDARPRALKDVSYPAQRIGVPKSRIYDLCRQNLMPHIRVGRQVRFDPEQIETWIKGGGQALPGGWRQEDSEVRV